MTEDVPVDRADRDRLDRWTARLRWPMVVAALASLPVILLDESDLREPWNAVFAAANWLIWLAFAVELGVLVAAAPEKRRWLRHHPLELAIVLLTPPFAPASLQAARFFRLLLVLRALAAASVVRTMLSLAGLRYATLLALITVLGGGTAFAAVERGQHLSAWDGVWWAIVTVTTVGYGDITPKTNAGRVIGIVVMLFGIGFIATLTAAIAQRFIAVGTLDAAAPAEPLGDESLRRLDHKLDVLDERLERLERRLEAGGGDGGADGAPREPSAG
jgi:voltage-gated potassium channel